MTREEIEQIIRENIRTNGRGEITARVMAGVLESFVLYTDTQSEDFAELCRQLAAAFNALVQEMEGKFETKAEALEAAMEAFCSDLLNNHFIPWAEGLAGSLSDKMDLTKEAADAAKAAALEAKAASLEGKAAADQAGAKADEAKTAALEAKAGAQFAAEKSTAAKAAIDSAADGIAEALLIIREGNKDEDIIKDGRTVVFYDYDGTVLYAYTPGELLAMEDMPAAPEHDGLTAQGWNWTLAAAKAYVQKYGRLDIGQIYKPTDGKLHLRVRLTRVLRVSFAHVILTGTTIDWGDGSDPQVVVGGAGHTYEDAGEYDITIDGLAGELPVQLFYSFSEVISVFIPESITGLKNMVFGYNYGLKTVVIPNSVTAINGAFGGCYNLSFLAIPASVTEITANAFTGCSLLRKISFSPNIYRIGDSALEGLNLLGATLPDSLLTIENEAFFYAKLSEVDIPEGVISLGSAAFKDCYALRCICHPVTPPALSGSNAFDNVNPVCIFVPDASLAAYKAATNWAALADIIFPISEKF